MDSLPITDPADSRVAEFRNLNDAPYRRAVEAAGPFHKGIFAVEGWLAVERLIGSRYAPRAIFVSEDRIGRVADMLATRPPLPIGVPVYTASRPVLDAVVGFPMHRGIVATAERGLPLVGTTISARASRIVAVEGIGDAENLGVVCRNAAAFGADALLIDSTTCDPLARRTVRVSVGHVLRLPVARVALASMLRNLTAEGVNTVALTPGAGASDIANLPTNDGQRVAIVLGAEGPGLSDEVIESCAHAARIEMAKEIDSLNVATAAGIAMHRLFVLPSAFR